MQRIRDPFRMPPTLAMLLYLLLLLIPYSHSAPTQHEGSCPSNSWVERGTFCYLLVKGESGRNFSEAVQQCRAEAAGADLLWFNDASELSWFQDYDARQWGIKRDWSQCADCINVEAAWIGAYRDSMGQFRWIHNYERVSVDFDWWIGQPRASPDDFVLVYDIGSRLRYRTYENRDDRKFWHFCKVQHREQTTTTLLPTTTTLPYVGPCPSRDWVVHDGACYLLVKGSSGRAVTEAQADCSARGRDADLLWIETDAEMSWVTDNSSTASWNLRRDWSQCSDCQSDAAAWILLRRNGGAWLWGGRSGVGESSLPWFPGHPRDTPNDFASLYDTGSGNSLRLRSEEAASKMWHICKFRFSYSTTSTFPTTTTTPTTTVSTLPPTTTRYDGSCPSSAWVEHGAFCYLLEKGQFGRTFNEAQLQCRNKGSGADLLWINDANELNWFQDYNARQWGIKNDWMQCTDCANVEAAWIGAYRDSMGQFRWIKDQTSVGVDFNWWINQPRPSPADFVLVYDTGRQFRYRTDENKEAIKYWHFCKIQHREQTTAPPLPTTTTLPYVGPCPSRDWVVHDGACYLMVKGSTGRAVTEAQTDCSARNAQADLLWIETDAEMSWVTDNSRAAWNLRRDWSQCSDCQSEAAAWILLRRQSGAWVWGGRTGVGESSLYRFWFVGHPKPSPYDFASLYDTGVSTLLRLRSEHQASRMWHICKLRFTDSTATSLPTTITNPTTVTTLPPMTTRSEGPCPSSEWLEHEGFCYLLVKGQFGRTFNEALSHCRGLGGGSDLLWISDTNELYWFEEHDRDWGIRRDWDQCSDCAENGWAAWIGVYRDTSDGRFRWIRDQEPVSFGFFWWIGHPKATPADFVLAADTGTGIWYRTDVRADASRKYWHFCKAPARLN